MLKLIPHLGHFIQCTSRPGPPAWTVQTSPPVKSGMPVDVFSMAKPGFNSAPHFGHSLVVMIAHPIYFLLIRTIPHLHQNRNSF
jgi:hypothetical protein